jgi:hypothetical protein
VPRRHAERDARAESRFTHGTSRVTGQFTKTVKYEATATSASTGPSQTIASSIPRALCTRLALPARISRPPCMHSAREGAPMASIAQTRSGKLEGEERDGIHVFLGVPFAARRSAPSAGCANARRRGRACAARDFGNASPQTRGGERARGVQHRGAPK